MRPRILLAGPQLSVGGTERHLMAVLTGLAARGLDVHFQTLERGGVLEAPLLSAGIEIVGPVAGMGRTQRALAFVAGLRARLRHLRPDLLHLFLPEPTLLGAIAAETVRVCPYVVSRRSLAHYREGKPLLGALDRAVSRRALMLIGNSKAVVEELIADCGDPEKVALIHNGVVVPEPLDPEQRSAIRAQAGAADDMLLFVVVANLIPYKGHLDLIAAFSRVADRINRRFRVALIGRDDGCGIAIDEAALTAGISKNVVRLGLRRDAIEFLAAADVAILPSHQEGFSNALIEGLAAGVPTIATAVGGNIDAIEHEKSGLLVPVANPDAMGAAILRITHDTNLAQVLGVEGRRRARALFSETVMLDKYEHLYCSVTGPHRSPTSLRR